MRLRSLRRSTFLAAAVTLALSIALPSGIAYASSVQSESALATNRQAAHEVLRQFAASHPAGALAAGNYIGNGWAGGLGVIHVRDGNYTYGTHDAVLPSGKWTDIHFGWANAAGWYTGAGYCTSQLRSDNGGPWYQQFPDLGAGQHFIGSATSYFVVVYDC